MPAALVLRNRRRSFLALLITVFVVDASNWLTGIMADTVRHRWPRRGSQTRSLPSAVKRLIKSYYHVTTTLLPRYYHVTTTLLPHLLGNR